ncbi:hypothetical protein MKX01_012091 [Papaver californicum]|nr:hypothetical protein MKX01_012091 [Papaver californicum]
MIGDATSVMAGYRLLRTLIKNANSRSLRCLVSSASSTVFQSSSTAPPISFNFSSSSRFLSPSSRCVQFSDPMYLSYPPLQSAMRLFLHGEAVRRKKTEESLELNLNEKKSGGSSCSSELGVESTTSVPRVVDAIDQKESRTKVDTDEGYVNLPNMISMSRLISGPFLGWIIINEWYLPAFVGLAVSGATDWLDGYVARKMGINSVVGSYLDPLADKVLIGSVAVAMVKMDLLPSWLVGLVLFRDVGLVGGALYQRASTLGCQWRSWSEFTNLDGTHRRKVEPLFLSKVNTVFQLVLVAAALLQPEFGTLETEEYIKYLSWLVAATTAASTVAYGEQYYRRSSMVHAGGSFPRSK